MSSGNVIPDHLACAMLWWATQAGSHGDRTRQRGYTTPNRRRARTAALMEYRLLGRSGVNVGALALGTMMFGRGGNADEAECVRMVHRAIDAGINLFDTADGYGLGDSEEILGRALAAGGHRADAIVATKCYFPRGRDLNRRGGSRRWIVRACEESLRRLGTDHIDLYQLHRIDPHTDLEESLGAMHDLVKAGKVRMVGHSGVAAEQLVECQWVAAKAHLNPSRRRSASVLDLPARRRTSPAAGL